MISIRSRARRVSGGVSLVAAVVPWAAQCAGAAPDSQLRRGAEVAQLQCSACHVVAAKQKYPPLLEHPAPSFQSIANRPANSDAALRRFVATTHWDRHTVAVTMPNPGLSKTDIAAVVRYILSMKSR